MRKKTKKKDDEEEEETTSMLVLWRIERAEKKMARNEGKTMVYLY